MIIMNFFCLTLQACFDINDNTEIICVKGIFYENIQISFEYRTFG